MALEAPWLWDLKDWIDRAFMAMYSHQLPTMASEEAPQSRVARAAGSEALEALSHTSMRCGGCGAKVGATTLSRVMARLKEGGHLDGEQAGEISHLSCPLMIPTCRASAVVDLPSSHRRHLSSSLPACPLSNQVLC